MPTDVLAELCDRPIFSSSARGTRVRRVGCNPGARDEGCWDWRRAPFSSCRDRPPPPESAMIHRGTLPPAAGSFP